MITIAEETSVGYEVEILGYTYLNAGLDADAPGIEGVAAVSVILRLACCEVETSVKEETYDARFGKCVTGVWVDQEAIDLYTVIIVVNITNEGADAPLVGELIAYPGANVNWVSFSSQFLHKPASPPT